MAHSRSKIKVNGHEWAYIKVGKGKPLMMLHGLLNYADFLLDIAEHLSDQFEIIIPDLPGFGFTKRLPLGNTAAKIAGGLVGFTKELGYQKMNYYGFSMGGNILLELAYKNPEIVESAIINAAPWREGSIMLSKREALLIHSVLYMLPPVLSDFLKRYFLDRLLPGLTKEENDEIKEMLDGNMHGVKESLELLDINGTMEIYKSLENTKLDKTLYKFPFKSMVIAQKNDSRVSFIEEEDLATRIGAKFELLENADHSVIFESPRKIAKIIQNFLK